MHTAMTVWGFARLALREPEAAARLFARARQTLEGADTANLTNLSWAPRRYGPIGSMQKKKRARSGKFGFPFRSFSERGLYW